MNIAIVELHSCAHMNVHFIFFLFFSKNFYCFINRWYHNCRTLNLTVVMISVYELGRARIDNNRREYCVRWAAQLCIHACVLRFFSSFFPNNTACLAKNQIFRNWNTRVTIFWFFFLGRARIDNNRREYCAHRAAQLCVHACVLFFSFIIFYF